MGSSELLREPDKRQGGEGNLQTRLCVTLTPGTSYDMTARLPLRSSGIKMLAPKTDPVTIQRR